MSYDTLSLRPSKPLATSAKTLLEVMQGDPNDIASLLQLGRDNPDCKLLQAAQRILISKLLAPRRDPWAIDTVFLSEQQLQYMISLGPVLHLHYTELLLGFLGAAEAYETILPFSHTPDHELVINYNSAKRKFQDFIIGGSYQAYLQFLDVQVSTFFEQDIRNINEIQIEIDHETCQAMLMGKIWASSTDLKVPTGLVLETLVMQFNAPCTLELEGKVGRLVINPDTIITGSTNSSQTPLDSLEFNPYE